MNLSVQVTFRRSSATVCVGVCFFRAAAHLQKGLRSLAHQRPGCRAYAPNQPSTSVRSVDRRRCSNPRRARRRQVDSPSRLVTPLRDRGSNRRGPAARESVNLTRDSSGSENPYKGKLGPFPHARQDSSSFFRPTGVRIPGSPVSILFLLGEQARPAGDQVSERIDHGDDHSGSRARPEPRSGDQRPIRAASSDTSAAPQ
jgi:hypothetical protein